jgi:hypothetical protein
MNSTSYSTLATTIAAKKTIAFVIVTAAILIAVVVDCSLVAITSPYVSSPTLSFPLSFFLR